MTLERKCKDYFLVRKNAIIAITIIGTNTLLSISTIFYKRRGII